MIGQYNSPSIKINVKSELERPMYEQLVEHNLNNPHRALITLCEHLFKQAAPLNSSFSDFDHGTHYLRVFVLREPWAKTPTSLIIVPRFQNTYYCFKGFKPKADRRYEKYTKHRKDFRKHSSIRRTNNDIANPRAPLNYRWSGYSWFLLNRGRSRSHASTRERWNPAIRRLLFVWGCGSAYNCTPSMQSLQNKMIELAQNDQSIFISLYHCTTPYGSSIKG